METRIQFSQEEYFSRIRASFSKRFICTFLDLFYVIILNLPIWIIIIYHKGEHIIKTFHDFVDPSHRGTGKNVRAHRCMIAAIWMFFVCYLYFVYFPARKNRQTIFNNLLNLKLVTLNFRDNPDEKLSRKGLFGANLIPIFSLIFANIVFFLFATIRNDTDWDKSFKNSQRLLPALKVIMTGIFFVQFFYFFTTAMSRKSLNWFNVRNNVILIDLDKLSVFERGPGAKVYHAKELSLPGVSDFTYEKYGGDDVAEDPEALEEVQVSPIPAPAA